MSSIGPCFEEGFECPAPYLSCYRDCCERGVHFCNRREKRCQRCESRQGLCGSLKVPWECDVFCLEQEIRHNKTLMSFNGVSQGYQTATFSLAVLVAILFAVQVGSHCRKRKAKKTNAIDDEKDDISVNPSTDQTETSCEDNDKDGQGDLAEDATKLAGDEILTCAKTIAREEEPLLRQSLGEPACTSPPAPCQQHHHHPLGCRDRRLDNICPTSDTDRDVFHIHTGCDSHSARMNYSVE